MQFLPGKNSLFSASPKANNLKCEEHVEKRGAESESKQRSCNKVPRINYKREQKTESFRVRAAIFAVVAL
jgi:hypothetical protein